MSRLEGELAAARQRATQAEAGAKARAGDLERAQKLLAMTRASEYEMSIKQVSKGLGSAPLLHSTQKDDA